MIRKLVWRLAAAVFGWRHCTFCRKWCEQDICRNCHIEYLL